MQIFGLGGYVSKRPSDENSIESRSCWKSVRDAGWASSVDIEFDKMRLPYNINTLSQTAVQFALEHAPILEEQSFRVRKERTKLIRELEQAWV